MATLGLGWPGAEWWPRSTKWHSLRLRQCWLSKKMPTVAGVTLDDLSAFTSTTVAVVQV